MVSLLLRHGADTQLCNSALERPVDVANDYDIIQLLSRHTRDGHLSDDVTPVSVTSSEHDVMVNRAGCDEVEACSHHEPLDSATAGESGNFTLDISRDIPVCANAALHWTVLLRVVTGLSVRTGKERLCQLAECRL